MIFRPENMEVTYKTDGVSGGKLTLCHLVSEKERSKNQRLYALASLDAGATLHYHMHSGEAETYYFLSGKGIYNDNGQDIEVEPGMLTNTPSGTGHALKNTGTEPIVFIASIVVD